MKSWEFYVDRIEENEEGKLLAVVELPDFSHFIIPVDYLPEGTKEGSLLKFTITLAEDGDETDG